MNVLILHEPWETTDHVQTITINTLTLIKTGLNHGAIKLQLNMFKY